MRSQTQGVKRTAVVIVVVLLSANRSAGAEWIVKTGGAGSRCVVESGPQPVFDGYQNTTATVAVDQSSVTVRSPSVLDATGSEIGLQVDRKPFVPMDRLRNDRTATFDASHGGLVEQFKAGRDLRIQLKFWPTWPATGTHSISLSLIGFTRAFTEMLACR